jgi:hypothetical protein
MRPRGKTIDWLSPSWVITRIGGGDILQEEVCAENNRVIGIPDVSIPTELSPQRR